MYIRNDRSSYMRYVTFFVDYFKSLTKKRLCPDATIMNAFLSNEKFRDSCCMKRDDNVFYSRVMDAILECYRNGPQNDKNLFIRVYFYFNFIKISSFSKIRGQHHL